MMRHKVIWALATMLFLLDMAVTDTAFGTNASTLDARFEQDHPAVSFSCPPGETWYTNVNTFVYSGGSLASAMSAGCRATFSFTGTAVHWIGVRDEWSGIARVFVDGQLTASVDTFASPGQFGQILFSVTGLSPAAHSFAIEVTGTRNPASGGTWIGIDAFDIVPVARFEQDHPAVSFSCPPGETWYTNVNTFVYSGGSLASAMSAGCRATFSFTGTAVHWIGVRDEGSGIARVFVDGQLTASVDAFASPAQFKVVLFSLTGLPATNHTLTIEVTGTRNPASAGTWIGIDAFDVDPGGTTPAPTPEPTPAPTPAPAPTVTRFEESAATFRPPEAWFEATSATNHVTLSGDRAMASFVAGATATFTFTGTGVSWLGVRCESCGIARVFLDGALVGTFDTFAPTRSTEAVFTTGGLPAGSHTLVIEVTGDKNPSSRNPFIGVDAFDVTS